MASKKVINLTISNLDINGAIKKINVAQIKTALDGYEVYGTDVKIYIREGLVCASNGGPTVSYSVANKAKVVYFHRHKKQLVSGLGYTLIKARRKLVFHFNEIGKKYLEVMPGSEVYDEKYVKENIQTLINYAQDSIVLEFEKITALTRKLMANHNIEVKFDTFQNLVCEGILNQLKIKREAQDAENM